MVKAGDRNLVPIYVLLVGLMAITLVTMRYSKRARGCTVNLSLLAPLGLFAFSLTSLAANLLTAAVSPGDPRVAILHSTLSRATLIISLLMLVEAASKFLSRYRSTSTST